MLDAVRSGWVSSAGAYLDRFEREFARATGTRHAIATSNGTTALHLALHALGLGPGDEVIVPALTFVASAHAVLMVGATPVLADVDPRTWCLDPLALERSLTPRTRAVMPVHLYGQPADMPAIGEIARRHGLMIVEDAAEAQGAHIRGELVGSIGDVGAFSFYGNKIMTTGEGGMVVTDDDRLAARLRFLKDHGMSPERRYFHTELAFNYRMTNLQAALGVAQLERIDWLVAQKRRIMSGYREHLAGREGVELNPSGIFDGVFWMSCALLERRDRVAGALAERGIDTRPFFVTLTELPHLADCRRVGATEDGCPVAESLSRRGLSLPSGCTLADEDVEHVSRTLISVLEAAR